MVLNRDYALHCDEKPSATLPFDLYLSPRGFSQETWAVVTSKPQKLRALLNKKEENGSFIQTHRTFCAISNIVATFHLYTEKNF